jgi:hypothetical protein
MPEIRTNRVSLEEQVRNTGARRRSQHINRYPAVNIHHARRFASGTGLPFNWMVTINFGLTGVEPEQASATLQKLLAQRFAPWLRRAANNDNQVRPTYVWALEAPHGVPSAHLLLHLPPELSGRFSDRLVEWIEGLAGSVVPRRAVDVRQIRTLVGATRYILKGIHQMWGPHLGVQPSAQGEIVGKRSGFSRNLGPTARRRAGYKPKRHLV